MALSIVMLVLVAGTALADTTLAGGGEVGSPAPDFSLVAQNGGTHSLNDYRGRVVVLFIIGYG